MAGGSLASISGYYPFIHERSYTGLSIFMKMGSYLQPQREERAVVFDREHQAGRFRVRKEIDFRFSGYCKGYSLLDGA
ncbi:hypothetical protein MLD38_013670 [Melastoma candidum]|uniref:Uncharacterized protein n=1 Tax=Melastoma candidum TaxID=119954 RepID=A0ACB9RAA6_9MYRT|nr:hypothetical protein MLD38_013670 [Melastoma candidum]